MRRCIVGNRGESQLQNLPARKHTGRKRKKRKCGRKRRGKMKSYWKRAAGALKDRSSIWRAGLARKSIYRNPNLEAAIIKATSHDETWVDKKNIQRVYTWVQTSPRFVRPLVWALSNRMERTRSWVVALKGLMLMHGVFCTKIPSIKKVGCLPFDLSNFNDAHSKPAKVWGYNAFVRAYFTFLDQKSSFMCNYSGFHKSGKKKRRLKSKDKDRDADTDADTGMGGGKALSDDLETLQKLQYLLDLLLQVKPQNEEMRTILVLEAMDCIITEIYHVYDKIWKYIQRISSMIYTANRYEATLALRAFKQANTQSEELFQYFEYCVHLGVLNASEFPRVDQVAEEDLREVQRLIDELWEQKEKSLNSNNEQNNNEKSDDIVSDEMAIVESRPSGVMVPSLATVVTDKWEIFEDGDDGDINGGTTTMDSANYYDNVSHTSCMSTPSNALLTMVPQNCLPSYSYYVQAQKQEVPDLISF